MEPCLDLNRRRVVTIGGGHGQAIALRALRHLDCSISAVVATADDGGCSGELRRALDMPAPGDLRKCLAALALDQGLARELEDRIGVEGAVPRCRGNLVIAQRFQEFGSLQQASDWVGERLGSVGRVMPASEEPGTLVVCDRWQGFVEGEDNVARTVAAPLVVSVKGGARPNPTAMAAIAAADVIVMGPGSFCTSTLSALLTGGVGAAVCRSSAQRLFILNLTNSERPCSGFQERDFISVLANHLTICSLGDTPQLTVLRHASEDRETRDGYETSDGRELADNAVILSANIAADDGAHHNPDLLARALGQITGLPVRAQDEVPRVMPSPAGRRELAQALAGAEAATRR